MNKESIIDILKFVVLIVVLIWGIKLIVGVL